MQGGEELASACKRRHGELKRHRTRLEPLWQDAARRIMPAQANITGDYDPEERVRMDHNFDSTALLALGKFAAAIEAIATPRNAKWHNLAPSDPALAEDVEVMRWCDAVRDILFDMRARKSANFAAASHETFRLLGVFGHGTMLIQHQLGKGIRYMSIPTREIWAGTDEAGAIDTVHRKYSLTVRQALREFDGLLDDLPREILAMKDKPHEQDKTLHFMHCVFPNPDHDPERAFSRAMPWRSVHILLRGNHIVRDSGYRTMPYMIPRYETIPGSPYGFGPGLLLLPEIKMVNEMGKTIIRAAHLATSPPLLVKDDDILSAFSVTPDSMNWGGLDDNGRPTVQPLQTGQRFDVGLEFLASRQVVINDAFLVTLFQILVEQPQMTATEVLQRANEKGELLAPTMGRLQSEMLAPCIERELDILAGVPGLLPPMPPQLEEAGGLLTVEYASPLAKAMQSGEALGILRLLEALLPMAQFDPGVMDIINPDEAARTLSKAYSVPAKDLRSPEEVAALRQQRAQAQQAAAALEAAPVITESARNLAQAQSLAGAGGGM